MTARFTLPRDFAVPAGLGGGSPRNVLRAIAPDLKHPLNGNALYVFALPQ